MQRGGLRTARGPGPGPYRRLTSADEELGATSYGGGHLSNNDVGPLLGSRKIEYNTIILFFIAVGQAILVSIFLIALFTFSSNHGEFASLVQRIETVENLARNVDDGAQVLRRALGHRSLDEPEEDPHTPSPFRGSKATQERLHRWLEARDPAEEALITDKAADALARGIRTVVRITKQVESSGVIPAAARLFGAAEAVLAGPDAHRLLHAAAAATEDPQAVGVYHQALDVLAHVQAMALPLIEALSSEVRQQVQALQADGGELGAERFQAMIRELGDVSHKVGTGLRDLVVWYREGGPSDAAVLVGDMVRTARELIESPAADSLVHVLEGIDWKSTGHQLADASHHGAAILRAVNEAGTVDAGDHLIRAIAALLENPGTQRAVALLPAIASNATALLAQPNAQRLITEGSALMGRVEGVLGTAEASHAVERSAEFLGTFRLLLGALIDGGLHMELGQPERDAYASPAPADPPGARDAPPAADLLRPLRVTGVEPEKTRLRAARPHPRTHPRRRT